jgi:FkbM family methyltransferase
VHEERLRHEFLLKSNLFVDVGAHVGTWTIRCSKTFANVVAFEPQTKTGAVLRRNLRLNQCNNVTVQSVALSDTEGVGYMNQRYLQHAGETRLVEATPVKSLVHVRTLDDFGLSPDLLKIDVEGSESKVLSGGRETLKRTKKIIVEVHNLKELSSLKRALEEHGLATRVITVGTLPGQTHLIGERIRGAASEPPAA